MKLQKRRIQKASKFIGKLRRHKLDMSYVASLNGAKTMNPHSCNSAGCVMGWLPIIFPKYFKYGRKWSGPVYVYRIGKRQNLTTSVEEFFGIPYIDADQLFGAGASGYQTPKQVAKGLKEYVKLGHLSKRLHRVFFNTNYFNYKSYLKFQKEFLQSKK